MDLNFDFQRFLDERQNVRGFFYFLGGRFPGAVSGFTVDAQQDRVLLMRAFGDLFLNGRCKFQGMQRADSIIVVSG